MNGERLGSWARWRRAASTASRARRRAGPGPPRSGERSGLGCRRDRRRARWASSCVQRCSALPRPTGGSSLGDWCRASARAPPLGPSPSVSLELLIAARPPAAQAIFGVRSKLDLRSAAAHRVQSSSSSVARPPPDRDGRRAFANVCARRGRLVGCGTGRGGGPRARPEPTAVRAQKKKKICCAGARPGQRQPRLLAASRPQNEAAHGVASRLDTRDAPHTLRSASIVASSQQPSSQTQLRRSPAVCHDRRRRTR